jgi:8-oxo-dGTP pyrophosphatase MutT (NUDIX family)
MSNVHAAGVLLTHGDRALFLKRSDKARDHAGEWCCPGGSIEGIETPEQAARRETQEETGLTGLLTGDLTQIDEWEGFVTFRQGVDAEAEPLLNDEHTEFVWAPMTDPPQPLHSGVRATLDKILHGARDAEFKEGDHPRNAAGEFAPVATLTGHELGEHSTVASLRDAVLKHAEAHLIGRSFTNQHSGAEIHVRRSGIKKSIAGKHSDSLKVMPALPDLLQRADYLGSNPDSEGRRNIKAVHGYQGGVSLAGSNRTVRIVVRETPEGHLHYDHYLEIERPSVPKEGSHDGIQSHRVSGGPFSILLDGEDESSMAADRREWDENGWFEVLDNPLSKVGVYPYSEASVKKGGDRNRMVGVYRPVEELGSQECVNSFKLMPWTDDHPSDLFGATAQGFASTEEKGVRGVIGEKVYFKDDTLYGNLKIFSEQLARKIAAGKRELSCGYHCQFIPEDGVFNGVPYSYVQRNMRGNHVSSVDSGRMGSEVRVLDAAETFTFALDLKDAPVAREDEIKNCLDAETEKFIGDSFNSLVGELEKKGYSKEYATKVAGKVAAEKGMTGHHSHDGVTDMASKTDEEIKKEAADRKAARDSKRSARDAARSAKDSMSSEEEEGMDAAECAEDAEEEKDDAKDESQGARDRALDRARRAGARDQRKSARDKKAALDAKAAQDAANKAKGMDAAAVTALVDKAIAGVKVPSAEEIIAQVRPAIRKEEAAKASLYGRVSPLIGAFDHAEMTHVEMATYSLDKLGAPKGAADPVGALDFYLAGRGQAVAPQQRDAALDGAPPEGSALHRYLNA